MLRVVLNHRRAAHGKGRGYEGLSILPVVLDAADVPFAGLADAAAAAWDEALAQGQLHGYRNAQASVIAPTGTIGLVMDRSEEHTSELQSLMRISYAVFCLKKNRKKTNQENQNST